MDHVIVVTVYLKQSCQEVYKVNRLHHSVYHIIRCSEFLDILKLSLSLMGDS